MCQQILWKEVCAEMGECLYIYTGEQMNSFFCNINFVFIGADDLIMSAMSNI